jgi:preprotein translocase subunit SecF
MDYKASLAFWTEEKGKLSMSIVKLRHIWFAIAGTLIALSLVAIIVIGVPFGIDFTGGSLLEVEIPGGVAVDEVRTIVADLGHESLAVQETGEQGYLIRTVSLSEDQHQSIVHALEERFGEEVEEMRFDSIGPVIGQELRKTATWGIVITLLLIGLYIAFAFRQVSKPIASWKYGLLTIGAAFHDVILMLGIYIVVSHFYGWEVNSAFVAAALTILGYSINDTVVVFDRTRENLASDRKKGTFEDTVDVSVRQTLRRSLNTSITTLLALVAIFLFGGSTTQPFAFALIVGIIVGTYSSLFLASPALVAWEALSRKK